MNLNEVEKHVKFDIIFQLLIYIGIGLCLILSIIVILATPAKAATQLISQDITNGVSVYNGECTGSYKNYCVHYNGTTNAATFTIPNSELMGANNVLSFAFSSSYGFYTNSPTTITIEFNNNIKNNSNYTCSILTTDGYIGTCTATRTSNTKMNINFNSLNVNSIYQFWISNSSGINSSDYFGIKKLTVYQTVGSDNSDIINNANQNTNDIINNNNANSQDTQNAIFDSATSIIKELANACKNLFSPNFDIFANNGTTINYRDNEQINFTTNWVGFGNIVYALDVTPNTAYFIDLNIINSQVDGQSIVSIQDFNDTLINERYFTGNGNLYFSFNSGNNNRIKLKFFGATNYSGNNITFKDIMLSHEALDYCPFGSNTSKLDNIGAILGGLSDKQQTSNNIQQNEYDYLTDDTNPTVDSNGIQSTMNMVQTNNPLSYLLTLPTNLLSAIINGLSSNSCQDFEIGKFGHIGRHDLGTYTFKFPCIDIEQKIGSNLYNTIDIFVSVGILVLTIVKLYNTISNYLTLGAEDEVKAHSHFLTPMDFLGNILGGNIGGIGNSLSSMSGGL